MIWSWYSCFVAYPEVPEQAVFPDGKVHGANMGPIWGREDSGGPHVDPMNYAIWGIS